MKNKMNPLRHLAHGSIELFKLVLPLIIIKSLREGQKISELIAEEFSYKNGQLGDKTHRKKLEAQLNGWNAKTLEMIGDVDNRPVFIYAVNAFGWDNGVIYNSTSVRAWHYLRMKRLSKKYKIFGLCMKNLDDIQNFIDDLNKLKVGKVKAIEIIGHGSGGRFWPDDINPQKFHDVSPVCDLIANSCSIGSGNVNFLTKMAELNRGMRCWGATKPGAFATIYTTGRGSAVQVEEVVWCDELISLIWGSNFKMITHASNDETQDDDVA